MNEGYKSRNILPKPKKKRKDDYKVCDFADTMKVVEGGTSSEEDAPEKVPRSKAAREELDSVIPTENGNRIKHELPVKRGKKKVKKLEGEEDPDQLLKEINEYQSSKKKKKSTKKAQKLEDEDDQMELELEKKMGEEQRLDDLLDQDAPRLKKKSAKK